MTTVTIIELAVSAVVFAICFILRAATKPDPDNKKIKKKRRNLLIFMLLALWFFIGVLITALSGMKSSMEIEFDMFSPRKTVNLFGYEVSFSETSLTGLAISAIITVLCLIFRFFVYPKFSLENPTKIQNVLELAVEACDSFVKGSVCDYGAKLSPYMFSLAVFMVGCAASELLGLRAPTSDITVTLSMGLITFFLINYYGIKKKGLSGRIKALSNPTPVILPMKILSDVAVPISLACRLFGNMLGGMIVMELLKGALGGYATGIPAVAGLYFNLFHPLIQVYIFIILSLTFINESIE